VCSRTRNVTTAAGEFGFSLLRLALLKTNPHRWLLLRYSLHPKLPYEVGNASATPSLLEPILQLSAQRQCHDVRSTLSHPTLLKLLPVCRTKIKPSAFALLR